MREVIPVLVAIQVIPVKMVFLECLAYLENPELLANAANQVQQALRAKQAHVATLVMMVHLELLARMVDQEVLDNLVNLDQKVFRVQEVSMDVMVFLVLLVRLVESSTKMLMVPCKILYKVIHDKKHYFDKYLKASKAKKVNEVYQDSQVMMVRLVHQVSQVKMDHVEKTETKVTLVHLVNEVTREAWVDLFLRNTG